MEEEGKGRGFLPSLQVTGEGGIRRHKLRKRDGGGEKETKERGGEGRNEGRCGNCGRECSGEEMGNESKSGKREQYKRQEVLGLSAGEGRHWARAAVLALGSYLPNLSKCRPGKHSSASLMTLTGPENLV